MMKRIKAISFLLIVCTMIILICPVPIEAQNEGDSEKKELESDVIIGFDNVKETLKLVRLVNINKAEFCDDSKYVSQGKSCLRLCPEEEKIEEGSYYSDKKVVFYPAKASYSDVEYISIDVYNPLDYPLKAMLAYDYVSEEYTIEPGNNTLWLYIDRAQLEYSDKGLIKEFFLEFEGGSWETDPLDVYVDNFKCYYARNGYEVYTNDFTQNVWYSFEETGDLANFVFHGTKVSDFSKPMFNINHDVRFIKNGTGSLRVDFRNAATGALDARGFRVQDNQLGDLNRYLDDLEGYYIGFPIYNANDSRISCTVTVYSNYNDETMKISTEILPGSWSDANFIISLADLKKAFSGSGFDIKSIAFAIDGLPDGGTVYLDSIGIYPVE